MTSEEQGTSDEAVDGHRAKYAGAVGLLTSVNVVVLGLAFITSPLLARILGPSGRGEVAAVMAVVNVAPWIAELGLTAFVSRMVAVGDSESGALFGSVFPVALFGASACACTAPLVAHLLGRHRPAVVEYMEIGLWLLPLSVLLAMATGAATGRSDWRAVSLSKLLNSALPALAFVAIAVFGHLSVGLACLAYFGAGIVAFAPLARPLVAVGRWRFKRSIAAQSLRFGASTWIANLASLGNAQLDQVLMAGLVPSRELGFYALATSLSNVSTVLTSAIVNAAGPAIAKGDRTLVGWSTRVSVAINLLFVIVVAGVAPLLIQPIFGSSFAPMLPVLLILCFGSVLAAPCFALSSALIFAGSPRFAAVGQFTGLVLTVPALFIVLPGGGAVGAAWVSAGGSAATLLVLVVGAVRTLGLSVGQMFVITASDISQVSRGLRGRLTGGGG